MMRNKAFVIVFLIIVFALGIYFYLNSPEPAQYGDTPNPNPDGGDQIFCTMDAKLCPNGSYVGRTPPKCEFAPCPIPVGTMMEDGTVDTGSAKKSEMPY